MLELSYVQHLLKYQDITLKPERSVLLLLLVFVQLTCHLLNLVQVTNRRYDWLPLKFVSEMGSLAR